MLALALAGVVVASMAVIAWILVEDSREGQGVDETEARSPAAPEPAGARAGAGGAEAPRGEHDAQPAADTPSSSAVPSLSAHARARPAASTGGGRSSRHPDGGAPASGDGPDGGAKRDTKASPAPRRAGQEPSLSDEERNLRQVERFIVTGGATLVGHVVEADGGKPIAGMSVHVHHAGMFVEARTDASGEFRIAGMPPGSVVVVWVGRNGDPFIDERIAVAVPGVGQVADAGTVKLLRGDELSMHMRGWVGVFVTRRNGQVVLSAVSPWLPADQVGLEVGDQIVAIDGRDLAGLGPRAVAFLLRGPVGAPVTLVVRMHDHDKRKITLERVLR